MKAKNKQDATLININALKKRVKALEVIVKRLDKESKNGKEKINKKRREEVLLGDSI